MNTSSAQPNDDACPAIYESNLFTAKTICEENLDEAFRKIFILKQNKNYQSKFHSFSLNEETHKLENNFVSLPLSHSLSHEHTLTFSD